MTKDDYVIICSDFDEGNKDAVPSERRNHEYSQVNRLFGFVQLPGPNFLIRLSHLLQQQVHQLKSAYVD